MKTKFESLPKEYFAQKFSDPNFPTMSSAVLWLSFIACMIFYLVNIVLGINSDYAVVRFFSVMVLIVGAAFLLPALYFNKKRINKHRIGFVYCSLLSIWQIRFCVICSAALICSVIMSDGWLERNTQLIINICYPCAVVFLIEDVVVNIIFWRIMKKRIIDGAYKIGGNGFFGNMKHKDTIWGILIKISSIGLTISLSTIPLGQIFHFRWESSYTPILSTIMIFAVNWLIFLLAFCDALMLGRIHYMKKFENNDLNADIEKP